MVRGITVETMQSRERARATWWLCSLVITFLAGALFGIGLVKFFRG